MARVSKYSYILKRGVAQIGRALRSGRRGRGFESRHLDFLLKLCWNNSVGRVPHS